MKKKFKSILIKFAPLWVKQQLQYRPLKQICLMWFFQRVLRINSHVPWLVHWSSVVHGPQNIIREGDYYPTPGSSIGQYIQAKNGIIFHGRNIRMGPGVKLISADHDVYDFDKHTPAPPIEIGDNCWIGANAILLPGVKLGNHTIVAAGSVVTKSFPDNCLIAGVPARIIKELGDYGTQAHPAKPDGAQER